MNRRELLKKAGLVAMTSAPFLAGLAKRARADDGELRFTIAAVSYNTADPTGKGSVVSGAGAFNAEGEVEGRGCYNLVNSGAAGGPPKPLLEFGRWQAFRLISWTPVGTYGALESGILEIGVTLFPDGGTPYNGMLKVVDNIPNGGLGTGQPGGVTLTTPTGTWAPGAAVGRPQVGRALFCPAEDDD